MQKQVGMRLLVIFVTGTLVIFVPQSALSAEEDKPLPSPAPVLPSEGDRQKEAEEIRRLQEFYLRNQVSSYEKARSSSSSTISMVPTRTKVSFN